VPYVRQDDEHGREALDVPGVRAASSAIRASCQVHEGVLLSAARTKDVLMPDLATALAAIPKCPTCCKAMRWNHGCSWWWCTTCKRDVQDAGDRYA
jgi:hypothetical protein